MSLLKKRSHDIPGLNTASLPDLIFTVLFFFMIVTHIRPVAVKVKYRLPEGTALTRLTKKSAVSYIYIGKAEGTSLPLRNGETVIQLNDKMVSPEDISTYITAERNRMSPEDQLQMTVAIKADSQTKLGVLADVKQALRKANALRVSYSGEDNN